MKQVGILVRVSTEEQALGDSPEKHLHRAQEYCKSREWKVARVYRLDGVSAKTTFDIPEIQQMLEDIKSGAITGLIFSKLARLGRNTKELLDFADIFRAHGADLVSLGESIDTGTPSGVLFYTILAGVAQFEREEISSRMKAAYITQLKRGKGTYKPAFGYILDENNNIVPDSVEAPIRVLMHDWFLETGRLLTTAKMLTAAGYRTRGGGPIGESFVRHTLKDTTAVGLYVGNKTQAGGKKTEDQWITIPTEPIISLEKWEQTRALLQAIQKPRKRTKSIYGGLLYCECGTVMYFRKGAKQNHSNLYFCRDCRNKIQAHIFDLKMGEIFYQFDFAEGVELAPADERQALLKSVQSELEKTKRKKEKLVQAFQNDALDLADFKAYHDPLAVRYQELEIEQQRIKSERVRDDALATAALKTAQAVKGVKWCDLLHDEKMEIAQTFIERVVLSKEQIEVKMLFWPQNLVLCKDVDKSCFINTITQPNSVIVKRPDFILLSGRYSWGAAIKKERLARSLRVHTVARELKTNQRTVLQWERGLYAPRPTYIPRIVDWLGFVPWDRTPYQSSLGQAVAAARDLRGWMQNQLSAASGVCKATITAIESGDPARGFTLAKLEQALGVPFRQYLSPGGWLNPA